MGSSSNLDVVNGEPNYPALKLLQLAANSMQALRFVEAETHFREVLAHQPDNTVALHHLSILAYERGEHREAKQLLKRALQTDPDNLQLLVPYGQMLHETSQPREALEVFLRILSFNASDAEVWNAAGICLQETSQPVTAIEFYLRAIALQPRFAEAYNNLGVALENEGDSQGAIENFRQALEIDPDSADCHGNLGVSLRRQFQYAEAIASFREALRLKPDSAEYAGALGEALSLVYNEAAENTLRRGVELAPDDPENHWNLALELLKKGDYTAGWEEYEWRLQRASPENRVRRFDQPFWRGRPDQNLEGATILLYAEQGFGDTLQFLRYLPDVLAQGANVILEMPAPLHRLVTEYARQMQGPVAVLAAGESLPDFDWHAPLMSLPLAFGTTLENIPAPRRFTGPASDRDAGTEPLRVGLAWAGNRSHARDRERSLPFPSLSPLFNASECSWVSLQTGPAAAQIREAGIAIEQPQLDDFFDTAAVMDTLDLVLSADTAVAHLAASQGVPTWILLPFVADWRWLRPPQPACEPLANPWYPQARLFRQWELPDGRSQAELWKPVIQRVASALDTFSAR